MVLSFQLQVIAKNRFQRALSKEILILKETEKKNNFFHPRSLFVITTIFSRLFFGNHIKKDYKLTYIIWKAINSKNKNGEIKTTTHHLSRELN